MWKQRDESQVYTEAESNNNAGSYQDGGCRERNSLGLAKMTVVQGRECGEESWKKNSKNKSVERKRSMDCVCRRTFLIFGGLVCSMTILAIRSVFSGPSELCAACVILFAVHTGVSRGPSTS